MDALIRFMNGPLGRTLRAALGVVLIVVGLFTIGGFAGVLLAAVGLIPLALAATGRCLLEPFARTAR